LASGVGDLRRPLRRPLQCRQPLVGQPGDELDDLVRVGDGVRRGGRGGVVADGDGVAVDRGEGVLVGGVVADVHRQPRLAVRGEPVTQQLDGVALVPVDGGADLDDLLAAHQAQGVGRVPVREDRSDRRQDRVAVALGLPIVDRDRRALVLDGDAVVVVEPLPERVADLRQDVKREPVGGVAPPLVAVADLDAVFPGVVGAVDGAYYAGEHGIEISDGDERWSHAAHGLALDVLPEVRDTLRQRFDDDDGVSVEDKGSAVAVHYRQSERDGDAVLAAVRTVLADGNATDALRLMSGKQVVEVRPAIDWDKGDAVQLLCDRFTPDGESWLSVYVGDDTTDEDAFASVDGYAVAVGDDTAPTAAPYAVSDPDEVVEFVSWLADEGLAALEGTPERTAQVTDT